jgi:endonuclease/exonuclease/phosphatase family metal-dependent hydrolase
MRIITYNIRGGLGMDGRRETTRIADFVRALAPDIVCFQEVHQRLPWSGWINQPRILAKRLGMPFVFQKCVWLPWGGYGLGIATRFPVRHVTRCPLKSGKEPRGALRVQVATPQGPLSIFCTHWGLDERERSIQARQMTFLVGAAIDPVVVCGDLNDVPEASYIQQFVREAGLRDAGQEENAPTYPSDAPKSRIDVLLYPAMWSVTDVFTPPSLLSDHLPVVVDIDYGAGGGVVERAEWALK